MQDLRLSNSDMSSQEIARYKVYSSAVDDSLMNNDYDAYLNIVDSYGYDDVMTKDRFTFVHKNMNSNAEKGIYHITEPFLGVFGLEDENVDAKQSIDTYERIFNDIGKVNYKLVLYEDGNHGLMKSRYSEITFLKYLEILVLGERCFVDGLLDELGDFVISSIK